MSRWISNEEYLEALKTVALRAVQNASVPAANVESGPSEQDIPSDEQETWGREMEAKIEDVACVPMGFWGRPQAYREATEELKAIIEGLWRPDMGEPVKTVTVADATSRYHRLYDNSLYLAATKNMTPQSAVRLQNDALALCGRRDIKPSKTRWGKAAQAFLAKFKNV
jgi:hypothetical protein